VCVCGGGGAAVRLLLSRVTAAPVFPLCDPAAAPRAGSGWRCKWMVKPPTNCCSRACLGEMESATGTRACLIALECKWVDQPLHTSPLPVTPLPLGRFSPPTITSLTPSIIPTLGASNVVLAGDSFGSCAGVPNCYLRVTVTFPVYSILVDMSDVVRCPLLLPALTWSSASSTPSVLDACWRWRLDLGQVGNRTVSNVSRVEVKRELPPWVCSSLVVGSQECVARLKAFCGGLGVCVWVAVGFSAGSMREPCATPLPSLHHHHLPPPHGPPVAPLRNTTTLASCSACQEAWVPTPSSGFVMSSDGAPSCCMHVTLGA
jgi:hypothetical protein